MRFVFTFFFFLLNPFILLYAQQKTGVIKGYILNQAKPVELANIALLNEKDSSFVAGTNSDQLGFFQFTNITEGRYLLQISHLSFQKKTVTLLLDKDNPIITLDQVVLEGSQNTLNEVTATATKALFTKEKGKLTFNVENSIVSSLRTDVVDLISNLPGVWIDRQSNILLNGQQKVRITINDRPTYLTRGDLIQMLKAIPVTNVKAVEIIANPSSKYDAEGSSVINIKTKEHTSAGFVGVLNTSAGSSIGYGRFYPRVNTGIDLSLGKENFSVFLNYNYGYKRSLGEISEHLTFENSSLNQSIKFENLPEKSHSLSSGIDVKIGANQSVALFYTKNYSKTQVDQSNFIRLTDAQLPSSDILSTANENPKTNQDAFNLSYVNTIDSLNSLTLSADYIHLNKDQIADYENIYLRAGSSRIDEKIKNNSATGIKVWAGQIDYSHQVNQHSKLETGLKYSRVNTKNDVDFLGMTDGNSLPDSVRQNAFAYKENLAAIYMNYKTGIKKLNISAGLRYENSKMSGSSSVDLFQFKRDLSGLFPNLSLDHPLGSNIDLGFSYSRRIARPNYVDINPFIYYVNPYVALEGNPGLVPSFTNKFELSAQIYKKYSVSVAYLHTKDVFTTAQFQDIERKTQRLVPTNVGDLSNLELNLGIPFTPKSWWESYFNIGLVHQKYTESESANLGYGTNSKTTFQLFSQHAFTLPKGFGFELDNTLISPSVQGQFTFSTIYSFSAGLKKSFMDKKLDLKIGVSDFLKTLRYDGTLEGIKWRSNYKNSGDSRQFKFSLSYNFYKKGKVNAKDANWISTEEKKRMKP